MRPRSANRSDRRAGHNQRLRNALTLLVIAATALIVLTARVVGTPIDKPDSTDTPSRPPNWTKLRLKRLTAVGFPLLISARNGKFFLVTPVNGQPSRFMRVQNRIPIGSTTFEVTKFEEKYETTRGFKQDASELTVTDLHTGQQFVLRSSDDEDHPTTFAMLTYLRSGKHFAVCEGMKFTLPPENGVMYKVLKITEKEVDILKEDENQELRISPQTTAPR